MKITRLAHLTIPSLLVTATLLHVAGFAHAAAPRDLDRDGIPNISDPDVDNDGIPNGRDRNVDGGRAISGRFKGRYIGDRILNGAKAEIDIDSDGLPDNSPRELDIDGDGLEDNSPLEEDIDGDGLDDDSAAETDIDGDGLLDDSRGEGDIDGDGRTDAAENEADIDGDGDLDVTLDEEDIDGDGRDDDFQKETETDGDGVGNVTDNDVDGDGILNEDDTDTNGDGIADEFEVEFGATAVAGVGEAGGEFRRYEFDGTRIVLWIGVEGVPAGQYELSIGGVARGTFAVGASGPGEEEEESEEGEEDDSGETSGGIGFAANPTEEFASFGPLTFAPAGADFEIKAGNQVYFRGTIPVPRIIVNSFAAVAVQNVGEAGGEYEGWEGDGSSAVLGIGIEGAPVGVYDVWIGGVLRGTISVTEFEAEEGEDGTWTAGGLTFAKRAVDPGIVPLNFDPAGAEVVIKLGDVIYYTATVPTPPAA